MAHLAHYREAHPLIFVVTHWVNLIAMVLLIVSGFYIHFPLIAGWMGVARGVHIFCGFVFFINMLVRCIASFIVKSSPYGGSREVEADYKSFFPQKANRHQFGAWIKYYLFLKKDHPLGGKYGVPQKLAYIALPPLIFVMFITGLALWGPTMEYGFLAALTDFVGGPMVMRIIHYYLMWVFILFTFIHVYLATIEGMAPVRIMFFRKESGGLTYDSKVQNIVGVDDMGEDSH